ncbi:putative dihydropseudooxynicotine hydrolase [Phialemonium atrogriseum]|uniref:Dihydropseudooxynicotine hydrolase n=1 Tax=Phialemonium atrogriseum TaxID=1093897 RepID=A0AAJ0FLS6_9PEZI|nr:putative dihydropseudooxynicotine hydrolase [Phialemonium atrogriseum]KAK1765390.1 putative dihydropseudooxynicotine hydrolase [Phialemonium atrogriseum]
MRFSPSLALLGVHLGGVTAAAQPGLAMYPLSNDTQFAFILAEKLSLANGGGAATGEILRAASQIAPGDFESFYREFKFLADSIHAAGSGAKHPSARREAFFRSSAYYRAADFFLHGNASDPRLETLWERFDIPVIFYPAPRSRGNCTAVRRPAFLVGNGYDGPQEDLYHSIGRQVHERGWNFATYEGPGQSTVRRQQGLGFRPDWWSVVTPVVDYLSGRADVDTDRVALAGYSFAGTLAPRAASREHRLAAVLLIDGLYSLQAALRDQFPLELVQLFDSGNKTLFDAVVNEARANTSTVTQFRWLLDQGTWAFDTASPFEWFTQLGEYTLDGILPDVRCPVFVASGENDDTAPGQPEEVAKLLGSQGYYHLFKTDLGAGEHCQLGAEPQLAQVSLDWLEGIFEGIGQEGGS